MKIIMDKTKNITHIIMLITLCLLLLCAFGLSVYIGNYMVNMDWNNEAHLLHLYRIIMLGIVLTILINTEYNKVFIQEKNNE